jgi:tRNA threonylcarbamoyladenosine biosynthesis protein TsaE
MYGDLGVGKTAFVRGVAALLAPDADVCSPTYAICNEYEGIPCMICHFDVYRIQSDEDLYACGFYDYVDCISIVEWSENIPFALPDVYYRVSISKVDGGDVDLRTITIEKVIA